jgi:peptidyl-prolyl cis-trans isomerase B (cyclophilin B)
MLKLLISCLCAVLVSSSFAQTPLSQRPLVLLDTNYGPITIRLYVDESPLTTENFLSYVRDGFYDTVLFHKVVDGFIIQAGGFTPGFKPKASRNPIRSEARNTLLNKRGTVAMALTTDKDSAASQFFINVVDNTDLDYTTKSGRGFTVFGEVISGMEVVDKIKKVRTKRISIYSDLYKRNLPLHNVPEFDVVIKKASILRDLPHKNSISK